jgi:uncharacterized membrane protein YhaH (DUF805 family)
MPIIENWKLVVLERYAKFDGRAGRAEFWWYVLANIILNVAVWILVGIGFAIATGLGVVLILLASALYLALIVPSIAVAIRRLHDTDKSGWFLLVGLIPFVGGIILLVFYIQEGTAGPNQYGAAAEPAAA